MLGHPGQRVAQAGEVLGGGRPVHPLDGANRRGTGRSNSAPAGRVAPERPHSSRREEIVGPEGPAARVPVAVPGGDPLAPSSRLSASMNRVILGPYRAQT